jgi:hypothetical protein
MGNQQVLEGIGEILPRANGSDQFGRTGHRIGEAV